MMTPSLHYNNDLISSYAALKKTSRMIFTYHVQDAQHHKQPIRHLYITSAPTRETYDPTKIYYLQQMSLSEDTMPFTG